MGRCRNNSEGPALGRVIGRGFPMERISELSSEDKWELSRAKEVWKSITGRGNSRCKGPEAGQHGKN